MKGNMNNTSSPLTAFKRAPSLGLSQWENGNLTTNLAEKKDTNGAFFLVEANAALDELIATTGMLWPTRLLRFILREAKRIRRSSGYKFPLIIMTPGPLSLLINPFMRGLRHDARYNSLLAKIGLPPRL